jgi:RNA polymerase sigma-70 factor (ECF subfamily)
VAQGFSRALRLRRLAIPWGRGNVPGAHARLSRQVAVKTTDADLVDRCRRGEAEAFEELYRLHASRVYNLACRFSGSLVEGEDLLQDVFVQVFKKLHTFKGEAALGTWLYRLATNVCLDYVRSREGRARQITDQIADEPALPARRDTRPMRADRIDLERAIAALPLGYRAAFVLHDVEGFEHHEVAEMLGIAEGTSKSQVHKARLRIREYLAGASHDATGPRRV